MQIVLFVSSTDAIQPGWLLTFLKSISPAQIKEMQRNLAKVCNSANSMDSTYFAANTSVYLVIVGKFHLQFCFQQLK